MVTSLEIKAIAYCQSYRVITCWNTDICLIKARGLEALCIFIQRPSYDQREFET